jgi:hypothetical protein
MDKQNTFPQPPVASSIINPLLIALLFLILEYPSLIAQEPPDPLDNAVDLGEGWKWIDFFGSYQTDQQPWIFHEQNGWMYLGEGNLNTGQYFLDTTLAWIWTNRHIYPRVFSVDRNSWLLIEEGISTSRIVKDLRINQTLELENWSASDPFFNGFHLGNSLIPISQIVSGGPPRDGIPSLTNPAFVSISEADFMFNNDIVIAVTSGGVTRGYPFRILNWHELVNDRIEDDYFLVTYCPLCGTAIVFESEVNGIPRNFGVSGLLFQNNVLMYDRETFSLWPQYMNSAVTGTMQKTRLKWKPSEQITWADFMRKYPNSQVLSDQTGFSRSYDIDPYAAYFASDGPLFRTNNPVRPDLPEKEWVWGIIVGDVAKAYKLAALPNDQPIFDTVNGVELKLVLNAVARSVVVTVVSTGEVLDNGVGSFWFSWQDFFRDTLVFK